MKVIKPLKLGVMHRVFEHRQTFYFSVGIFAYFAFDRPARLLPEISMWKAVGEALAAGEVLDEGLPKPQPEVTVHGCAQPPGEAPVACQVHLRFGELDKALYVIGDRTWRRGIASDPQPFTSMPVDWAHAFGGEGFATNPAGRGLAEETDADGKTQHPLPNIEHPRHLIKAQKDRPAPVGFGAIDVTHPQRTAYGGSYDKHWLDNHFPGFPEDFDAHYFQTAPKDQWLTALSGGEHFSIENMHAEHHRIEGRLPHFKARCFITRTGVDAPQLRPLEEVFMRPETVRLFPNSGRGVLIYRGVVEVAEDDAADILQLMIAADDVAEERPLSHYQSVLAQRLDKEYGALHSLRERDLIPASALEGEALADETFSDIGEQLKGSNLFAANLRRKAEGQLAEARKQIEAQGMDPHELDQYTLPPEQEPVALDELPEFVFEQKAEAERQRKKSEEQQEKLVAQAREQMKAQGMDYDEMVADAQAKAGGPPTFRAKDELRKLSDQLELSRNAGVPLPEVEKQLADPELFSKLQQTEEQILGSYRRYAAYYPAANIATDTEPMKLRDVVIQAHRAGTSLHSVDLTGADLSQLDLAGIDLSGAFLEGANLRSTNLSGANLSDTVLARADLSAAKLTGANLAATNFGGATLHGTDLSGGVDAKKALFTQADMQNADLSNADLSDADMMEARLVDCKLNGVTAKGVLFFQSTLSNVQLRDACLEKCIFFQVAVDGTDFSGVNMTEATFVQCSGTGVRFIAATLDNLRLVHDCRFPGADFSKAKLENANFRETDLEGASFSEAQLAGADLSGCNLQDASFYRAHAPSSLWIRSDLRRANLFQLNAMLALMSKARLEGANLEYANLVRAELSRVTVDRHTRLGGADLTEARFTKRTTAS